MSDQPKTKKTKSQRGATPKKKKAKAQIQQSIGMFASNKTGGGEKPRANLEQEYPDPASRPTDHRVTEIQFLRDELTVVPERVHQPRQLQLSDEQRRVLECPADRPMAIRAGAGSGKTHVMTERVLDFIRNDNDVEAKEILVVSFSNKAADELRERIGTALSIEYPGEEVSLPTIKTFHGLAFSWICRCWKACGFRTFPAPLATKAQEKSLMKRAIKEHLDNLRLERCQRMLSLAEVSSWEAVVKTFRHRYPTEYNELYDQAREEADKLMPDKKTLDEMTAEDVNELREKVKNSRAMSMRFECYMNLLNRKRAKQKAKKVAGRNDHHEMKALGITQDGCDLAMRWKADAPQCNIYLQMIRKARLNNHGKEEYLRDDANIWKIYEWLQRETGKIDFDSMLIMFSENVLSIDILAKRFHSTYKLVIVDEFQDNSEVQAKILSKIVQHGRLTVVGDEDQCIYQFRGASPGNFARLKEFFAEEMQLTIQEETLTDNYRSSANILKVAGVFLEGDSTRHPKILRPTKKDGLPVEVWKCWYQEDQASHIVASIIERHKEGVPYGEIACLYRCFKKAEMGEWFMLVYLSFALRSCAFTIHLWLAGHLNIHLQRKLAANNIPFEVVGGSTIYERASIRDLMAYLHLSMHGSPDDESFERVLNKPRRRLPNKKVIPLIEKQTKSARNNNNKQSNSFQETAEMMIRTGVGLSKSQRKSLKEYLDLIGRIQVEANKRSLPELLQFIWNETGLEEFHTTKKQPQKNDGKKNTTSASNEDAEEEEEDSAGEDSDTNEQSDDNILGLSTFPSQQNSSEPQKLPLEIQLLVDLADRHVTDWKLREEKVLEKSEPQGAIASLVELTRDVIVKNKGSVDFNRLPNHLVDEIILAPSALGRAVIRDFLACTALQNSVESEESVSDCDAGRVSISTVHRAKGLEWSDVYVPYFNQGCLPTNYMDDSDEVQPHLSDCSARQGDRCDKSCAQVFQEMNDTRLCSTAEERHLNEERRLAHVAATRAKDRLIFTTFASHKHGKPAKESEFMEELQKLPNTVVKVVSKL